MTEWPTYETAEQFQARMAAQTPSAPMAPVRTVAAFPTWAGVTLAVTVGLLMAMMVVAISATSAVIQTRSELAALKQELTVVRKDLWDSKEQARVAVERVARLETEMSSMKKSHAELAAKARTLQNSPGGLADPFGGSQTPGLSDWADFLSILESLAMLGGY